LNTPHPQSEKDDISAEPWIGKSGISTPACPLMTGWMLGFGKSGTGWMLGFGKSGISTSACPIDDWLDADTDDDEDYPEEEVEI